MCLLCGHCHDKVTRGALSKETVWEQYRLVQTSDDVRRPSIQWNLNHHAIKVTLGPCVFEHTKALIVLNDEVVLAIEPPEVGASFPTLTGYFHDPQGNELFRIERNEWIGPSTAWDLEIIGKEILIRSSPDTSALHLRLHPDAIEVIALDMRIGNSHLLLKENCLAVGRISTESEYYLRFKYLKCIGAEVGVQVSEEDAPSPKFTGRRIPISGGIDLQGTGIKVGVGAGTMHIGTFSIENANRHETRVLEFPLSEGILQSTVRVYPPRI